MGIAQWPNGSQKKQADVLLFFYNDRATTFSFDLYPTFALRIGERFPVADDAWRARCQHP